MGVRDMQSEAVVVRAVGRSDLPLLAACEPPGARVAEGFVAHQEAGRILYAAAFDGGRPLGTVVLDMEAVGGPELKHLFVHPQCRGRGVGALLCLWVEDQARSRGVRRLLLGVAEDNAVARHLYNRLGYWPTGRIEETTYSYRDDDGMPQEATEQDLILAKNLHGPGANSGSGVGADVGPGS